MPNAVRARVAMEAGATIALVSSFVGLDGAVIGLDHLRRFRPCGHPVQGIRLHGRKRSGHRQARAGQIKINQYTDGRLPQGERPSLQ